MSTRDEIITAADTLFYQKGFEATSFAEVAQEIGISRGNFYYHFKTKDEILESVIERRLENTKALLTRWEVETGSPSDRLKAFAKILIMNRSKIKLYGCPVGTLCSELAKLDHGLQDNAAGLFTLFRDWLEVQFAAAGCKQEAKSLALHLLARSQGVATLASTFKDDRFIDHEVTLMCTWIDATLADAAPERLSDARKER